MKLHVLKELLGIKEAMTQVPVAQKIRLQRGEPEEGDGETSDDSQLSSLLREKNNIKKHMVILNKRIAARKAQLAKVKTE